MILPSSSCLFLVGQIDGEPREFSSPDGRRSLSINVKTFSPNGFRNWFDAMCYVGERDRESYKPHVAQGDWVLLWSFSLAKSKVQNQDPNLKETYRTSIRGDVRNVLNLSSLVHNGVGEIAEEGRFQRRSPQGAGPRPQFGPSQGPRRQFGPQAPRKDPEAEPADPFYKAIGDLERSVAEEE